MSEKWKKTQNIKNKLNIIYLCLAIFFIVMMLLMFFGLIDQEKMADFWDWSS